MRRWLTRRQLRGGAAVLGLVVAFAGLSLVVGDDFFAEPPPVAAVQLPATQAPAAVLPPAMQLSTATQPPATPEAVQALALAQPADADTVWLPQSGARYHRVPTCSGMQSPREATVEQAMAEGFTPCKRCYPDS